jgi:hypothetical protein
VDEGDEFRSSRNQWGDELLFGVRQAKSTEVDVVGRWAMAGERTDGGEITESFQGLSVVIEEAGDDPCFAAVGMLAGPGMTFAAEAARTDDVELFHVQAT